MPNFAAQRSTKMNLVEELQWRGLLHDIMPGTEELLRKERVSGYIGFDPTADSLHIGNMVPVMLLMHLQRAGHNPIALIGGATGMVGDPSGKTAERNLLDLETLRHNLACQEKQLRKFLDFETTVNPARIVNNYDWFEGLGFLDFIRDVGKHISVNYMMAKDSVKNRLEQGMSFTEFSYQLIQGYDFVHLYRSLGVRLQMGGSDQWGNITTGTELIRRMEGGEAFAITAPLVKKADGSKFGKSEGGNVWLDPAKTSPYKFYQFWLNVSDEDAGRYIRIFTLLDQSTIEKLEVEHATAPHMRSLQKALAADITERVHSTSDLEQAFEASQILFGQGTTETLIRMQEETFLSVFEGIPQHHVSKELLTKGIDAVSLLSEASGVFPSRSEARKMIQGGGTSINKAKITAENQLFTTSDLLNGKYLLAQKGKKQYFLILVS